MFTGLLDEHAPVKKRLIKREHVPFMTTELLGAIRRRRRLKQTYYATKDLADWQKYREQRNKTSSLRQKLICKYISKCDDVKGDPRTFWTVIKPLIHSKKNSGDNTITLKEDNELITDNNVIATRFNDHFSKIQNDSADYAIMGSSYCSDSHPSISAIRNNCPNIKSFNFQLISPAEVQQVVGKLEPNKATGHDGIPAKILRDCSKELALPLANLFNFSIVSECFPSDWKLAEVCPVFKKDDPTNICNYRPVSILINLDKIFEKCLNRQLVEHFAAILSPFLSAYRRGYSCEAVLLHLIESWRQDLDKGKTVGSVLLDLSKAFDLIPHNLLMDKLKAYGLSAQSLNLIKDYLSGRRQRVKVANTKSDIVKIHRGVPQGSVLAPCSLISF